MDLVQKRAYEAELARTRPERMEWWHEARYGMFVHWGLYAFHGRNEWVQAIECIPVDEYEKLTERWNPKPRPAREWAQLAVDAGMKYMVLTTKHHEGFCLWDTKQTDFNSVQACGRDGSACGRHSQRGNTLYFWVRCWPGSEIPIGGFKTPLKSARFLVGDEPIRFTQDGYRIIQRDLPETSPDTLAGVTVIALEFDGPPEYVWAATTPALAV